MAANQLYRLALILVCTLLIVSCEEEKVVEYNVKYEDQGQIETPPPNPSNNASATPTARVFICTGENAKSYHNDRGCDALNNCRDEIIEIDISEIGSRDRQDPCNRCVGY